VTLEAKHAEPGPGSDPRQSASPQRSSTAGVVPVALSQRVLGRKTPQPSMSESSKHNPAADWSKAQPVLSPLWDARQ
jgi:hypothetical protein